MQTTTTRQRCRKCRHYGSDLEPLNDKGYCPKCLRYRLDMTNGTIRGYAINDSSNIKFVGWTHDGIIVGFKGEAVYLYRGGSRQRAVAMAYAASVGKYLNARVKPHYEAVRL
jgi:hypothetical protein